MKHILLLTTGGTIASTNSTEGLLPTIDGAALSRLTENVSKNYHVTTKDILHLDSSNMQPEEWLYIARCIFEELHTFDYDGVLITHGTDTMAYTASALSFLLPGVPVPVVLTGSQLPVEHPLTDAMENLRTSFAMAASGTAGVFVAFNRRIILGTRAVKVRTTGFDAFESVNFPYIATVGGNGLRLDASVLPAKSPAPFLLHERLCSGVFLLKLTPGLNPDVFDMLLAMGYRGIVIEAFGAGGIQFLRRNLIAKLQKAAESGVAVVVLSQCLYESSDFTLYQTGKKALEKGVIQGYDMTTEAAVTKLMWALGQTGDLKEVRRMFARDYAGEISPLP